MSTITKLLLVCLAIILLFVAAALTFNDTTYTVTVTDKGRESDSSRYIVFTEKAETGEVMVFENTDNILRSKVNSSDMQGYLRIGGTYEITVIGIRIPLFSCYQNIISIGGFENE